MGGGLAVSDAHEIISPPVAFFPFKAGYWKPRGGVMVQKPYLLVISCSARKSDAPGAIPAIERYQGPMYQVLRKVLRLRPDLAEDLEVRIISARFGLLELQDPIENYELKMSPILARAHRKKVVEGLHALTTSGRFKEIFLMLGPEYTASVDPTCEWIPEGAFVEAAEGSIGYRLQQLKAWLEGLPK